MELNEATLLRDVESLPAFSDSVNRLGALLNNDRATGEEFRRVVAIDPALTADLLRVANSTYFCRARTVDSVRQAVAMLGQQRVYSIAILASLADVIPDVLPGYDLSANEFWTHNVAVAVVAEHLWARTDLPRSESLFSAAIMHDIGKLVFSSFLARYRAEQDQPGSDEDFGKVGWERAIFGTDHGAVGGMIAEAWNLPDTVISAARFHHHPAEAPEDHRDMVTAIHIANSIAERHWDLPGNGGETDIDPDCLARFGLNAEELESIADACRDEVEALVQQVAGR